MKNELPARCRGVNVLGEALKAYVSVVKNGDSLDKVLE
jgi:hypothetical protein